MTLREALAAVVAHPADLKARAEMAQVMDRMEAPEATQVWRATASLAGGRGQFFIALALARRTLTGDTLETVLLELARRYGAGRRRQGPRVPIPEGAPLTIDLPADDDDLLFTALRVGTDIDAYILPPFARMPTIPIFEELPDDDFVTLALEAEPVVLDVGDALMQPDAADRSVYLLVKGRARAVSHKPDGRELELGVHQGPTVLGEMALLTQVPRRAAVTALGPGLAWRIDADRLIELGHEKPAFIKRLRILVKQRLLFELLQTSQVLKAVTNKEQVLTAFAVENHGPDSQIFPQGAPAPGLYFILHGLAEVVVDGRVVAELTEGDAFGEMSLLTGDPTTAAVRMREGGILLHLDPASFNAVRAADAKLEAGLAQLMDVRRGELQRFQADVQDADDVEVIEELDGDWIIGLDD